MEQTRFRLGHHIWRMCNQGYFSCNADPRQRHQCHVRPAHYRPRTTLSDAPGCFLVDIIPPYLRRRQSRTRKNELSPPNSVRDFPQEAYEQIPYVADRRTRTRLQMGYRFSIHVLHLSDGPTPLGDRRAHFIWS
jgi:hypothetical protein